MIPDNEGVQPCSLCAKHLATETYTHERSKITKLVCGTCLDRLEVQDALGETILRISELEEGGKVDEALGLLDEIFEANRHRDHDGWLARRIANHRALMLFDSGRYAEAEGACEAWARIGFADVAERWRHALEKARTVEALGRHREALAVLEDALGYRDPKDLPAARPMLEALATISEKLGQPVDPKWRHLAEAFAKRYRVELPDADALGKAILELVKITRTLQPKSPEEWRKDEGKDDP